MQVINLQQKTIRLFLFAYIFILFVSAFFIVPIHDTYYYWTWSQNLQLSYLDGPPLIAYLLYITTHIFGNTFFAINIISIFCLLGSGYLIYKILASISDTNVATIGLLIWLTYPFASIRFITISMTLDGLEVMTSLLVLYLVNKLILTQNKNLIPLIGIAVGFSLLAKYNSILLVSAIVIYMLINQSMRSYILCWQFLIAVILALIVFSPVLIWNYQNDFISFTYQLHIHEWKGGEGEVNTKEKYGIKGVLFYLGSCVFGTLNILLITLAYLLYKHKNHSLHPTTKIWLFSSSMIFFIWLYKSYTAHIGLNYMLTLSALLILIIATMINQYISIKKIWVYILLCATISVIMQIDRSIVHNKDVVDYNKYVVHGKLSRPFIQ